MTGPSEVAAWIVAKGVRVLNVAGNRESTEPGLASGPSGTWALCSARS